MQSLSKPSSPASAGDVMGRRSKNWGEVLGTSAGQTCRGFECGSSVVASRGSVRGMRVKAHASLLAQAVGVWSAFWVLGLPNYYQQYSARALGVGCTVLSVAISLAALFVLSAARPATRMSRALWLAFYYTVPLAVCDTLYCGVYLGHGTAYLGQYWYLSVFYITPWLTFPPTALLLRMRAQSPS